jgi:hypothetical protein
MQRRQGMPISSAFTVWQDSSEGRKGRFVVNLSRQSKHLPKCSIRMETLQGFLLDLEKKDHLVSFDVKSGCRHFRLSVEIRKNFMFHYDGAFYLFVALPFGWGRSLIWFKELMKLIVRAIREYRARVLGYLDDCLSSRRLPGV